MLAQRGTRLADSNLCPLRCFAGDRPIELHSLRQRYSTRRTEPMEGAAYRIPWMAERHGRGATVRCAPGASFVAELSAEPWSRGRLHLRIGGIFLPEVRADRLGGAFLFGATAIGIAGLDGASRRIWRGSSTSRWGRGCSLGCSGRDRLGRVRGVILPWALIVASCAGGATRFESGGPYPLAIPLPPGLGSESDCAPPDPRRTICPESPADEGVSPIETVAQEMRQASDLRDHCRALRLAERVGPMRMGPSLRAFIAREQQRLGLLREAWAQRGAVRPRGRGRCRAAAPARTTGDLRTNRSGDQQRRGRQRPRARVGSVAARAAGLRRG